MLPSTQPPRLAYDILPSLCYQSPTHFSIQIRFLGDPSGQFTKDLDLSFESAAVFGQDRSKRYALVVEDGKVKSTHVEPDNTGVNGMCDKDSGVLIASDC